MAKQEGDKGYAESVKRQAMELWGSGQCQSDREIAEKLGIKRVKTVYDWRRGNRPQDWEKFRQQVAAKATAKAERSLGETLGEVTARQLLEIRRAQKKLLADLSTAKSGTSDSVSGALVKLMQEERQLMGAPGQTQELLICELSDDELRQRIEQRLAAIREARAAGDAGIHGEGMEPDAAPSGEPAPVPD